MKKVICTLLFLILAIFTGCIAAENSKKIESGALQENIRIGGSAAESQEQKTETAPPEKTETLVDGKTLSERLSILNTNLHTPGSGAEAKKMFPDFTKTYTDDAKWNPYFSNVAPFIYYYSPEAGITLSICNIGYTVFICNGKIESMLKEADYANCNITDAYFHPENYGVK